MEHNAEASSSTRNPSFDQGSRKNFTTKLVVETFCADLGVSAPVGEGTFVWSSYFGHKVQVPRERVSSRVRRLPACASADAGNGPILDWLSIIQLHDLPAINNACSFGVAHQGTKITNLKSNIESALKTRDSTGSTNSNSSGSGSSSIRTIHHHRHLQKQVMLVSQRIRCSKSQTARCIISTWLPCAITFKKMVLPQSWSSTGI